MSIAGVWWNELKSKMTIKIDPADPRAISGEYQTAVGGAISSPYPLTGRCDDAGAKNQTVGWVVAFDPPDPPLPGKPPHLPSLTAWSGQWHEVTDSAGKVFEFITTTWILTEQTDPTDEWDSTLVNSDIFFRTMPSATDVAKAKAFGKAARFIK
jgi:hypothetical protein